MKPAVSAVVRSRNEATALRSARAVSKRASRLLTRLEKLCLRGAWDYTLARRLWPTGSRLFRLEQKSLRHPVSVRLVTSVFDVRVEPEPTLSTRRAREETSPQAVSPLMSRPRRSSFLRGGRAAAAESLS
jgi:hypothetical protein